MNRFEEKTIQSKKVFTGHMIDVQVDEVMLPDGNTSSREIVKHPGAVAIIPITADGNIVFVEQYRKALERSIIEIPAGKIEKGENEASTAKRELEEETGYTAKTLQPIASFATSPGFADEIIHLYYTDELQKLDVPLKGDDDEFVDVVILSAEEAEDAVKAGKIFDAKTIYALLYVKWLGLNRTC